MTRSPRTVLCLMVMAWVPAAGLCSFAQEQAGPAAGGIQLQADLGPGGCYKSGHWTYVTGVASNTGVPFEGYVRVLLMAAYCRAKLEWKRVAL